MRDSAPADVVIMYRATAAYVGQPRDTMPRTDSVCHFRLFAKPNSEKSVQNQSVRVYHHRIGAGTAG